MFKPNSFSTGNNSPANILPDPGPIDTDKFDFGMVLDDSQIRALLFWPCMFRDHCLLINFGLVKSDVAPGVLRDNPELIPPEYQLSPALVHQQADEVAPMVQHLRAEARDLASHWRRFEDVLALLSKQKVSVRQVLLLFVPLWNATYILKHRVKYLLEHNVWIGYFTLSLSIGTLQELYYLRARLERTVTPQQEVALFMDDAALHMTIAAHFLDAGVWSEQQRQLVFKTLEIAEQGFKIRDSAHVLAKVMQRTIHASDQMKEEARAEAQALINIEHAMDYLHEAEAYHEWRRTIEPATVGHPLTVLHVIKEAIFELERLSELAASE